MVFRLIGQAAVSVALSLVGCSTADHRDRDYLRSGSPWVDEAAGVIRVVVEIPAYTRAKWEVDGQSGRMHWDQENGKPRRIAYGLPYLWNYGMLPRTVEAAEAGGDGCPLDVIMLGAPRRRGEAVAARVIAVMKMLDRGEVDDKLVAVAADDPWFTGVEDLATLRARFPGLLAILELWFTNYKLDPSLIEIAGFADRDSALEIVRAAHTAFGRQ